MNREHRERGHDDAALSAHPLATPTPSENGHEPALLTAMTPEERQTADLLAAGLGQLRAARPGFQDQLERRLLARLARPARPWWGRLLPARSQARPRPAGLRRLPRRSLPGLAAASALALTAASLSLPLIGAPEVSAREILEKARANTENPVLAGIKSYHLTARIWANHRLEGRSDGPHEMVTEQWFVSPDRMRTETRSTGPDGKPVVTGMMLNGSEMKHYSTDGANDVRMVGVFSMPAAFAGTKPPPGAPEARPVASLAADVQATDITIRTAPSPVAGSSAPVAVSGGSRSGEAKPVGVRVAVHQTSERGAKNEDGKEVETQVVVFGENCPEPKRTGAGTVAGRTVFVVETDLSNCLPESAPLEMRGRHIRWVDQQTFLPLKLEMYGHNGDLVDRYEVAAIEYDTAIPDRVFSELPAGVSAREPIMIPAVPRGDGPAPARKP